MASLVRGWERFHRLAHRHLDDPPAVYPVTADSLIRVGSLFKKGGCCAKAHQKGSDCDHPCCVKARLAGAVCTKCNAGAEKTLGKLK